MFTTFTIMKAKAVESDQYLIKKSELPRYRKIEFDDMSEPRFYIESYAVEWNNAHWMDVLLSGKEEPLF